MKKILSLFVAAIMLFAFSTVAFAAEIPFTLGVYDENYEEEISEINAGETFTLAIDAGKKTMQVLAAIISYNKDVFEILVDQKDLGYHMGAIIDLDGTFKFGGVNDSAKKVEAWVKIKVKDNAPSGDYTFDFVGCDEEFINGKNGDTTYSCDPVTITVIASAPAGPNWNKIDATVEEFESDKNAEAGYAYGVEYTCAGAAAMIFAAGAEDARLYSNEIAVEGTEGAVNVGFLSDVALENVGVLFRDADKANIWYSLDVDKH